MYVAKEKGNRADYSEDMTLPGPRSFRRGRKAFPGTGNVATPTLIEEGPGIREKKRPAIVTC
jgi:hypothetical protein